MAERSKEEHRKAQQAMQERSRVRRGEQPSVRLDVPFADAVYSKAKELAASGTHHPNTKAKVWIVDVYNAIKPTNRGMTLDSFKSQLLRAVREESVAVGREDMPWILSAAEQKKELESRVSVGSGNHVSYIRTDRRS